MVLPARISMARKVRRLIISFAIGANFYLYHIDKEMFFKKQSQSVARLLSLPLPESTHGHVQHNSITMVLGSLKTMFFSETCFLTVQFTLW